MRSAVVADGFAIRAEADTIGLNQPTRVAERPFTAAGPWSLVARHARPVAVATVACLVALLVIEIAVFRSGFFIGHVSFSSPDFPAAKLALARRFTDSRVLYVGDSTVMTGIMPTVVTDICRCGPGFNAGFGAASPWLTAAITRRVLEFEHPSLVVVGISPWYLGSGARFAAGPYVSELLTPAESAALGVPMDFSAVADARAADLWSAYGQRVLVKEWLASLVPGQAYDVSQRGYYSVPGTLLSRSQLEAAAAVMDPDPTGTPIPDGAGAAVLAQLFSEIRARGIDLAIVVPPFHPAATELTGDYLPKAEVALRDFAAAQGVTVLDCRRTIAPSDFRDLYHLNRDGAAKYSSCIGALLAGSPPS